MANRHLSRTIVVQSLFEWDFRGAIAPLVPIIVRNVREFARGSGDIPFMQKLGSSVLEKKKDLDAVIEQAAPEWPIEKISLIDRNVLRVGLYELIFSDRKEVPAKVAINEAIEIAKEFGGENSGKFVNGVLGAVYKELGEPGKDEDTPKRKKFGDVSYDKMPQEKLGGAVVYALENGVTHVALVHDIFGHWTLSKGKIENNESVEECTVRKIKKEIGLDIALEDHLSENEYIANDPEVGKKRKHVTYFLARAPYEQLTLKETGGLDDARWFPLRDIGTLNFYEDIVPIITKAVTLLSNHESRITNHNS